MTPVDVVLVQTSLGTCSVVAIGLVDVPFLRANKKGCRLIVREVETCDRNFSSLVMPGMLQLQSFLTMKYDKLLLLFPLPICPFPYLRLGKHIHQPTAYQSIRATSDEIVRILRTHDLHRINRVRMACSTQWSLQNR